MLAILRRYTTFSTIRIEHRALMSFNTFRSVDGDGDKIQSSNRYKDLPDELMLSPLFSEDQSPLSSSDIKVVDSDTWELSSGLAHLSKSYWHQSKSLCREEYNNEAYGNNLADKAELNLDEIEDMRIHGRLFYKIDRDSKEFDEYKFEFHRRKPHSSKDDDKETEKKKVPSTLKCKEERHESIKERIREDILSVDEHVSRIIKDKYIVCALHDKAGGSLAGKKQRKPTFNQLTGPYHEPFCLDIYISKQSVRACVVHRVTSKVVAVAHSISKDMKFDLGSTRNSTACAAVGKILAQRALADDIHDLIFTPRKGDKLEGKLQIVLQSVIHNGLNAKMKLKQRNGKKAVAQRIT